jgi:maltose alpha-D-glucosyltransferase/alpha-amylase
VVIDPEYHYSAVNVENQENNQHSLLRWMRRLITLRRQHKAFGWGTIRFLNPENRRVLAFVRETESERVLVVANLSRFTQAVELPLNPFRGMVPEEMFGRNRFPAVGEAPYFLSLGPHAFSWFLLREPEPGQEALKDEMRYFTAPRISLRSLDNVFASENREKFEERLGGYLKTRRWFQGKSRTISRTSILDVVEFAASSSYVLIVGVMYPDDNPETYCVPVSLGRAEEGERVREEHPEVILAHVEDAGGQRGVLYSATRNAAFCTELLGLMSRRRRVAAQKGELAGGHSREFRALLGPGRPALDPTLAAADQSNSSLLYGTRFILKLIRRIESGIHPEVEIGEAIAKMREKPGVAPLAGWIEYRPESGAPAIAGILHGYIEHETDAWRYTLENLSLFFEHALSHAASLEAAQAVRVDPLSGEEAPEIAHELTGAYLTAIRQLGARTAEFHLSMSRVEQAGFAPEPFTDFYRMGLYHGLLATCARVFDLVRERLPRLTGGLKAICEALATRERDCEQRLHVLRENRISATRVRIHGSYDLGSALYTGKDFVLIDLEGETDRPLGQRRIKRSPLRDVAGMMQSLRDASRTVAANLTGGNGPAEAAQARLDEWADLWRQWAGTEFFAGYINVPGIASLLPQSREERRVLMEIYTLETAFYDLEHGLTRDAGKAAIAARAILDVLDANR